MNPVRVAAILVAAFAASIGAALFAHSLASNRSPRIAPMAAVAAPEKPMARVLVAKHDLQPGDVLTAEDFNWQAWPVEGLNAAFVTDGPAAPAPTTQSIASAAIVKARETMSGGPGGPAQPYVGAIVREAMLTGEPIVAKKVVRSTDTGVMAVALAPGMRAMAVPLSAESAAGGFILPGDHVDVVQSRKVDAVTGAPAKFASGTVLNNVRVMAIDQMSHTAGKMGAQIGATATLEVSPEQAEFLALSKAQGELTLILRSYADTSGGSHVGTGPRVAEAAATSTNVVRVYRNGAVSDVMVAQ